MKTGFTLLPANAIKLVAELLTKGLEKYPDEKWRTLSVKDHLAAALRHINAYLRGEAFDEDSPSHLINAATRLLFARSWKHWRRISLLSSIVFVTLLRLVINRCKMITAHTTPAKRLNQEEQTNA